jgi:hypothetical protein
MRAFAMRLGFAVAGLHNFPGRMAYEQGAEVFFKALDAFAGLGHHPELANIPFVMYGSSNGGAATYGFINHAPERAICFVSNVAGGGSPDVPVDAALKVPGIFIIGKFDALTGQRGMEWTSRTIEYARPKGALWTWALELKGHEDGFSFDVYMKLVEQAVALRYPAGANPKNGPVKLIDLKEESGWLADLDSWENGFTYVDSYEDYKKDKKKAGWVLNKDMAYIYRSLATHHNPLHVWVREFDRTYNPNIQPGTMFSLGGPVVTAERNITIVCDTEDFTNWQTIEFFNGSEKLGEVKSGNKPEINISLDPKTLVYCLMVVATDGAGNKRTSDPMHFFVEDPNKSWKVPVTREPFDAPKTNRGSKNAGRTVTATLPNPNDSVLVAYALSAEQEKQFAADPENLSAFWNTHESGNFDFIEMTARNHGRRDAEFNPVITHDCNMTVRAAYGADGIYLLFVVNDDNDVAWPNEWAGTEKEQFYLHYDVVDMLMDSRSVKEISDPANSEIFVSRSFGLTSTTRQYQVACGTPRERALGFIRSKADPWDFYGTYYTFEDAGKYFGIKIRNIKIAPFYKAQEWFIPWKEIGAGLPGEPPAGTRFAFTAGFNDRDEGEHMEPGRTSSGGSVKASNSIRWIGRTDPWSSGPQGGTPPYAWGEIELGGSLK